MNAKICRKVLTSSVRGIKCKCCTKSIPANTMHAKVTTPKMSMNSNNGYHFHMECSTELDAEKWAELRATNENYSSLRCICHRVIANASLDDSTYFVYENHFNGKQFGDFVKYTSKWYNNAESIGSVVATLFKKGCRVWVEFPNGEKYEVKNHTEYKNYTDLGWWFEN